MLFLPGENSIDVAQERMTWLLKEASEMLHLGIVLPQAPSADLSIWGLQTQPDLDFVGKVVKIVDV